MNTENPTIENSVPEKYYQKRDVKISLIRSGFDKDTREFEAFVSTTDIDSYDTIIESRGLVFRDTTPLLLNHNPNVAIGRSTYPPQISDKDVRMKFRLTTTRAAEDAAIWLEDGTVDGFSIGFDPVEVRWDDKLEKYRIVKANVYEVSLTPIPSNDRSRLIRYKDVFTSSEFRSLVIEAESYELTNELREIQNNFKNEATELITQLNKQVEEMRNQLSEINKMNDVTKKTNVQTISEDKQYITKDNFRKIFNEVMYGKVS